MDISTWQNGSSKVKTELSCDYLFKEGSKDMDPIVLLHGYGQTAKEIIDILGPALPENSPVLVPNGIFLVPRKTDAGFKNAYSWFFYDPNQKKYIHTMDDAVKHVSTLTNNIFGSNKPISIVGYSQGGYLAPFVGCALPQTTQVTGLGCRFIHQRLLDLDLPFELNAIHGDRDSIVEFSGAKESFDLLVPHKTKGSFISLPDTGHQLKGPLTTGALKKLLK